MAKKRSQTTEESQRQSRKEILRARKQEQQLRQIRLGLIAVASLLVLIVVVALVNEYLIAPNRAVAVVNGEEISLGNWQQRVIYERAQRIVFLENQLEAFDGDVGIIQQFAGQSIVELQDAEGLGQTVLNQMVDEVAIWQAAEERGITVTDADVDQQIGENFNYFNGESPTPIPTGTATIMPTPSLTPIPTAVITEVVPTTTPFPTATLGPAATPRPTATPVSEEAFQQELTGLLDKLKAQGTTEAIFREAVRAQIYRLRLTDALAEEQNLPTEGEHASLFVLTANTEADANEAQAMVEKDGFLTVWNSIRSSDTITNITASEILWRTQDLLASDLGEEGAAQAFSLALDSSSGIITHDLGNEEMRYLMIQVSGREIRPLSQSVLQDAKTQALSSFIDTLLAGSLELTDFAQGRAPSVPLLDQKFLAAPTPTPQGPPETFSIPQSDETGSEEGN